MDIKALNYLPSFVSIMVHPRDEGSKSVREIIEQLGFRYHSPLEPEKGVKLELNGLEAYIYGFEEEESQLFFVAILPSVVEGDQLSFVEEWEKCEELVAELKEIITKDPISAFTICVRSSKGIKEAKLLLKRYLEGVKLHIRSMGIVRGCLLIMLEDQGTVHSPRTIKRDVILISFDQELEEATKTVWRIISDLSTLASCVGRLNKIKSSRELAFQQIDYSEENTQVKINEIFATMRRHSEIGPEGLESVLKETTTLFSSLSILVGAMRRDYVKALSLIRQVESLFKAWNEESILQYPTNSSVELDHYKGMIAPFEDFIHRVDALRAQLNTVLDAARTSVGIQSQKLSLEEQSSSKDLLVRLVNLQEILHKLEVLIIAFYITEMGKLVFEAFAHEKAGILTVAFIPIALVISMAIRRLLHGE